MQTKIQIRTYNHRVTLTGYYFFVLNKGCNSGKPLAEPCPNCFVIRAESEAEKQYWYWLCWGLWQSRSFAPYLSGSVIPFLSIGDFKTVLSSADLQLLNRRDAMNQAVDVLQKLLQQESALNKQLKLITELKRVYFKKVLSTS